MFPFKTEGARAFACGKTSIIHQQINKNIQYLPPPTDLQRSALAAGVTRALKVQHAAQFFRVLSFPFPLCRANLSGMGRMNGTFTSVEHHASRTARCLRNGHVTCSCYHDDLSQRQSVLDRTCTVPGHGKIGVETLDE